MSGFAFALTGRDGAARARPDDDGARRRRDAGVPAGRHPGRREGGDARGAAACGAQIVLANTYHLYLRPGSRADPGARRAPPLHELERADPHRFRRVPGLLDGGTAHAGRGGRDASARTSTGPCSRSRPNRAWRSSRRSARTWRWCSTSVPPLPAARERGRGRGGAHDAVGRERSRDAYRGPGVPFGIVQGGTDEALASAKRRGDHGARFPRLRDRRRLRRRAPGGDRQGCAIHGGAPSGRAPAVPDGRRPSGGPRRGGRRGNRPVRLRHAHAQRAERDAVHVGGQGEHQARAVPRRPATPRPRLFVRDVRAVLESVPATPVRLERDPRFAPRTRFTIWPSTSAS